METGCIKPIDRTSVHKICSGQVVLTLATAVKELVENSLDAGATIVEVKLKEFGSELVEVIDNGNGVKSTDFQSLTLKHHTSKIADFSDIPFVSTFGFRGEALSSLCALSDLEITTCHADSSVGAFLSFDHNGILVKNIPTHRQVGTTVTLRNLFSTFPVRHKEFLKNLRKEFAKMVHLLTAYCLISTGKRITCCNITEKGKKNIVLCTNSCMTYRDNIISVFGDKQMKQLIEIQQCEPLKDILDEFSVSDAAIESCKHFKLEGYLSNSTHGEGRSSSDRQFFFITGRPCNFSKVSKLINEVYHSFNKSQYPFVLLNISLNEVQADVNVTPDKREIFIPNEKVLLALVKATLLKMYDKQPAQLVINHLNFGLQKKIEKSPQNSVVNGNSSKLKDKFETNLKRKFNVNVNLSDDEEDPIPRLFKSQKLSISDDLIKYETGKNLHETDKSNLLSAESKLVNVSDGTKPDFNSTQETPMNLDDTAINFTMLRHCKEEKLFKNTPNRHKLKDIVDSSKKENKLRGEHSQVVENIVPHHGKPGFTSLLKKFSFRSSSRKAAIDEKRELVPEAAINENLFPEHDGMSGIVPNTENFATETCDSADAAVEVLENEFLSDVNLTDVEVVVDERLERNKRYQRIEFGMEWLREMRMYRNEDYQRESCGYRKFRSKIAPTENQVAEEELKKEIRKDDFSEMNIIGQFNLGFIIARLRDDLFIIDQHATDEKYNFEQLRKETVLETQQLLQPQSLNLTAVSAAILLDNLVVFEKNGFKFKVEEDRNCGEKVQLISVPVSHNWKFGKEDIDELIFMLTDNPGRMVRPSKVNQMFASRACRKSVMVGTALTVPMMKKLVNHMGEIEQPWNCPHGRPTIRHLFNLNILNQN